MYNEYGSYSINFTLFLFCCWALTVLMCVCESLSHVRLFCDPVDCTSPGSSVHGILQTRILEWVAIPFSRGSSQPRTKPGSPTLQADFFTIWAPKEKESWVFGSVLGLHRWYASKESTCEFRDPRNLRSVLWSERCPWRRKRQATPVFLPGEPHGQRTLAGYSPWGHTETGLKRRSVRARTHTRTHAHARTHARTQIFLSWCVTGRFDH